MAESNFTRTLAFEAGEDLTTKQNHFVNINSDKEVVMPSLGARAIGVNLSNVTEGQTAGVMCESGSIVIVAAGAAVALGADIESNAAGRAITLVATKYCLGVALEAAAADGDLIPVLFQPRGTDLIA